MGGTVVACRTGPDIDVGEPADGEGKPRPPRGKLPADKFGGAVAVSRFAGAAGQHQSVPAGGGKAVHMLQKGLCAASSPTVVTGPCPGYTTVSEGSV